MERIFGIKTGELMATAVYSALESLFESGSNMLSRTLSNAKTLAYGLTGAHDTAIHLVNNTRDLVNNHIWDHNGPDCRLPFKKYYRFLLPIMASEFHADTERGYDAPAAASFGDSLGAMDAEITVSDDGRLMYGDSPLTYEVISSANRKRSILPGDRHPPETRGHYTITRIDRYEDLDSMGLYEYTGWCICRPVNGEYQFDNYSGPYHSYTCYIVARDGFRDIANSSPDYPSSLIGLFISPDSELKYAFNRDNDMVSKDFIEETIDNELGAVCPPHLEFTADNICNRLQYLMRQSGNAMNTEDVLYNVGISCRELYRSHEDLYWTAEYQVHIPGEGETILFEFNTGKATPPNYRLFSNPTGIINVDESDGTIVCDNAVYDRHYRTIYTPPRDHFIYGTVSGSDNFYLLKNTDTFKYCNIVCVVDGRVSELFDDGIDISHVSKIGGQFELSIRLEDGTSFEHDFGDDVTLSAKRIARTKPVDGYQHVAKLPGVSPYCQVYEVYAQTNTRIYRSNLATASNGTLLPQDYNDLDSFKESAGDGPHEAGVITYVEGGYIYRSYDIDPSDFTVTMTSEELIKENEGDDNGKTSGNTSNQVQT